MKTKIITLVGAITALGLLAACGGEDKMSEKKSGYFYAIKATQQMQDDDFNNPGMLWADIGAENWGKADGEAGKSCASCHGDASKSMANVGATYPIFDKKTKKPLVVEERINRCRTDNMKAKAWKWESDEMMGMTMHVRMQARGKPVKVDVSGPMKPFWEKGKAFFERRRGQMDMACTNCHEDYEGVLIRANLLTAGMPNGFPTYRLKWQKPGSLHRRFAGCNDTIRAKKYGRGSPEYTNLEVYVTWRANGLPVETPSVRN